MDIAKLFGSTARQYDSTRKKYIDCFEDFYRVAVEQIPFEENDEFCLLDIGAGTGLLAGLVKEVFPNCRLTLSDISGEMLKEAQNRFSEKDDITFLVQDYIKEEISGKYDVIISALSLHHSDGDQLHHVFRKINHCLVNNGIFINADQILGETEIIEQNYEKRWLEQAQKNGCSEEEISIALKRMEADKTLPLNKQLDMLSEAGFKQVNCWYQYYRFAVYSGIKKH